MIYPDTSFLSALYVPQRASARAVIYAGQLSRPLAITLFLLFEFRQSLQFQIFRHSKNRNHGYPRSVAQAASAAFQADMRAGFYTHAAVDWEDVHQTGERLAMQYTGKAGHRSLNILHIATALHLGAREFLTFNANQKKLAEKEGLTVPV